MCLRMDENRKHEMNDMSSLAPYLSKLGVEKIETDPWALLLLPEKETRDALSKKDIRLTKLEVEIIDSPEFQRLREIQQIPFADFVYIGATHTRFEHSIGILDKIQTIIDNINRNADRWKDCEKLSAKDIVITRIIGLIHDLAHLAYPHILEDGAIFKERQWADKERLEKFLGKNSRIYTVIKRHIEEAFKKCGKSGWEEAFNEVIEDIRESLRVIEEGGEGAEREVIFADIVGNTICADVLDYIPRDIFHTGLGGQYDDRIFSFFVIKRLNGKRRLVIRLFKNNKYRDAVLSSCMEILELRYQLASKVYYHHTRSKARAMATEMVSASIKAGILNKAQLLEMGGVALREYILNFNEENLNGDKEKIKHLNVARKLARHLKERNLYDVLYEQEIIELRAKEIVKELQEDWEKRYETEREIETLFELEPGDLIIFAPSRAMDAKKTLKSLVEVPSAWEVNIKTLDELERSDFPDEYRGLYDIIAATKSTLIQKHELLWKLNVYVKKDVDIQKRAKIKTLLEQWFKGLPPVTAIEALAEQKQIKLPPTKFTEIAHEIMRIARAAPSKKSLFVVAIDVARSLLSER